MKILIAGASGFIGSALKDELKKNGDEVFTLVRDKNLSSSHAFFWDPENFMLPKDLSMYENMDAYINLAGDNISSGRWTKKKKQKILNSRCEATKALVTLVTNLKNPPKVFLNASATGFYGNRGGEILTEMSCCGSNFLSEVCTKWEASAAALNNMPLRLVVLRLGPVLSSKGGVLSQMIFPFKMGLGGKIGSGKQYFSFISLKDLMRVILFALKHDQIKGLVNATSPYPVKNEELTKSLAQKLNRPAFFSIPSFAAQVIFGQMADELLLASARVYPKKLIDAGFQFEHPTIESVLNDYI